MSARDTRAGGAYVEVYSKTDAAERSLKRVGTQLQALGNHAMQIGRQMVLGGAMAAAALVPVITTLSSFEDQIAAVGAVSGATADELEMLRNKAKQLGATTSFTATQVGQIMTELGRAGFTAQQIDKMTESVLALSRATGTDAAISAGIMASTIRQFGLEAEDAARVADVLTLAANSTFNTVEGLGESLKYAGPVAKSLNMSFEDTVALLGVLGNVGIQGSEAGTALRRLSVISAGAGKELKDIFGVSNVDAVGQLKPLVQILDEINEATADLSVEQRTSKMNQAFGLLGITSANVLSESADGVSGLADRLRDASGVADEMARKMDDNIGGSIRVMLSALEGAMIRLGEALVPVLRPFIEDLTELLGESIEWIGQNEELLQQILQITTFTSAAGGALMAAGLAIQTTGVAVSGLSKGLGVLRATAISTTAALTGFSIVLGAVAIAGLVLAVGELTHELSGLNDELERSDEASRKLAQNKSDKQTGVLEHANTISTPVGKEAFLKRELEKAKQEMQGLWARKQMAQQQFDDKNSVLGWGVDKFATLGAGHKAAESELATAHNQLEQQVAFIQELEQKLAEVQKLKPGETAPAAPGAEVAEATDPEVDQAAIDEQKLAQQAFVDQLRSEIQTPAERFEKFRDELADAFDRGEISGEEYDRAYALKKTQLLGGGEDQELQAFAEQVKRQVMTPAEQFEASMQRLNEAVAAGVVDKETADRYRKSEEEALAKSGQLGEAGRAAAAPLNRAVDIGSSDALNTVLAAAFGGPKIDEKQLQTLQQVANHLATSNTTLGQIKTELQKEGPQTTNWSGGN